MDKQIIAIAGMSGSGKSTLMFPLEEKGYSIYDDLNNQGKDGTIRRLTVIREKVKRGDRVAVSDILFCAPKWHDGIERILGQPIYWICFENDPMQCKKNSWQRNGRKLDNRAKFEFQFIDELSAAYHPRGEICPVWIAATDAPPELPLFSAEPLLPQYPFPL